MACLFCFSSAPLADDEKIGRHGSTLGRYSENSNKFELSLCQVPCSSESPCCVGTMLCYCPAQVWMRHRALNHVSPGSGWSHYTCCQGYYGGCCCIQPGQMGEESCPALCMCLESCIFPGLAVSATSMVVREAHNLGLDEDDVRLIRCSNCLQIFSCFCNIIACLTDCEEVDQLARIIDCVADILFCSVAGCTTAQAYHEIKKREGNSAPQMQEMFRY
mmetsp:Transcript_11110/g.17140  ORF Transcript_11110/g.17140 Transcript_11110/m.17140 type:complete len:218 (+) Transcript_11110:36-689(+)